MPQFELIPAAALAVCCPHNVSASPLLSGYKPVVSAVAPLDTAPEVGVIVVPIMEKILY